MPDNPRLRPLRFNVATGLATSGFAVLAGFLTSVITARGLGPEARGLLTAIVLWTGVFSGLSLAGSDDASIFVARGSKERAVASLKAFAPRIFIMAAMCCIGLVLVLLVVAGQKADLLLFISCAIVVVISNQVTQVCFTVLRSSDRFLAWSIIQTIPPLTYGSALLVLWLSESLSVGTAIVAWASSSLIACFIASTRVARGLRFEYSLTVGERVSAKLYANQLTIAYVPVSVSPRAPQLVLGLYSDHSLLGVYSVASAVTSIIQMAAATLEKVLFPRFVLADSRGVNATRVLLASFFFSSILAIPPFVFAEPVIVFVYGEEFRTAASLMRVLLLAAVLAVVASSLTALVKSGDNVAAVRNANCVLLVVTLVGILLVPVGSPSDRAAVSTSVGYLVAVVMLYFSARGQRS